MAPDRVAAGEPGYRDNGRELDRDSHETRVRRICRRQRPDRAEDETGSEDEQEVADGGWESGQHERAQSPRWCFVWLSWRAGVCTGRGPPPSAAPLTGCAATSPAEAGSLRKWVGVSAWFMAGADATAFALNQCGGASRWLAPSAYTFAALPILLRL